MCCVMGIIQMDCSRIIFLMGPTSSGKTALALLLKKKIPVEIISADSRSIYRGMDIGTSKPMVHELMLAPHRLINIRDPSESYSAANFFHDALFEIYEIINNGNIPLLVGGTMLYFKLLLDGLSPMPSANYLVRKQIEQEANLVGWPLLYKKLQRVDSVTADKIHPNDKKRLLRALEVFLVSGKTLTELTKTSLQPLMKYRIDQFAILPQNRDLLYRRITHRFYHMLSVGFENEVSALYARSDIHATASSICSVGYRQMWSYLSGKISYNEMVLSAIRATRQLAKHQITWLRGWRSNIHYLKGENIFDDADKILQIVNF